MRKTMLVVLLLLLAGSASAQSLFAPGAAQYPSPGIGRHFLDQPVAQCVIAVPVNQNAVMLTPCPVGAPPVAVQLPAAPPPPAEPKAAVAEPPREIVIRVEVVPVAPAAAPKATPAPAPKKPCPC